MAARSQSSKEKQKQKRKTKNERRKRRAEVQSPVGSGVTRRQQQRIAQQRPEAWPGERPEDVAVFDDAALDTLEGQFRDQVLAVREGLQLACDCLAEEAQRRVADIPRSSPLGQWRLFLRGLVAWLAEDYDSAAEAWKRLDFERRPGRMAVAMMNALRNDLSNALLSKDHKESQPSEPWGDRLDGQLLYHAKLLRRARFDRPALKIAETVALQPEESKELLIGPRKIRSLKQFVAEYRDTEPELCAALQQVALERAFAQPYTDLFQQAAESFEGPRHDPRNLLRCFFYFINCEGDLQEQGELALEAYLEKDLPNNQQLSEPLRAAIASQIHLEEAKVEIQPEAPGMFSFFFAEENPQLVRRHLQTSIETYPANRAAYQTYRDWLQAKLDDHRTSKAQSKSLSDELARVMKDWAHGVPEDAEPRLWLVDYLLENEQMDQAKPHVDWLAGARHDNPLVRATPWKWHLLEAMRLCRRKTWLSQVPAHLEEAQRLWPAWLSQQWLPYLKAAVTLRAGKTKEFESQRQAICEQLGVARDSLVDACMILGAAQRMRVPAASLKPLRDPVDQAVEKRNQLALEELLDVCVFFWDLHRTRLFYPAFRMHGKKFVQALLALMEDGRKWLHNRLDDPRVHAAVLLFSEHRCLDTNYEVKFPAWFGDSAVAQHPMFAAARLNTLLKLRFGRALRDNRELGSQVRQMAGSLRDPYYRYWLVSLADQWDEAVAERSRGFGFGFNPFEFMFGSSAGNSAEL